MTVYCHVPECEGEVVGIIIGCPMCGDDSDAVKAVCETHRRQAVKLRIAAGLAPETITMGKDWTHA